MSYVTEKRFRHMGLGVSLAGLTSAQIRQQLALGGMAVDSYCNVPTTPQRYSFKGGAIVGEQKDWNDVLRRRVYPLHTPLKAVSSLRIEATNNLYVDFEPSDFYINRMLGYLEIVNFALTKVGIWGNANVPSLGLSVPVAVLDYTYGYAFPVVDEELVASSLTSGEEDWTEYMAECGYWDPDVAATIKKNGTALNPSEYSIDHAGGFVRLEDPATADDTLTASYTYSVPREVQQANALATAEFIGESSLKRKGMTGIESLEIEEVRIRRIGSRSGAEKGVDLPAAAQLLLDGYRFMTMR